MKVSFFEKEFEEHNKGGENYQESPESEAVEVHRTLCTFAPDELDCRLRLAQTQTSASRTKDPLTTVEGCGAEGILAGGPSSARRGRRVERVLEAPNPSADSFRSG